MDKQKVIQQFQARFSDFLRDAETWLIESHVMQRVYDGYSLTGYNGAKFEYMNLNNHANTSSKVVNAHISLAPAYCRAVCGTLLRDRKRVAAVNMSSTTSLNEEADVMDDMFQAFEEMTLVDSVKYQMVSSAAKRGVGASVFYLDDTIKNSPFGAPREYEVEHIFFDRGKNGNLSSSDISWCGYADRVQKEDLEEYIERNNKEKMAASCDFSSELLRFYSGDDQASVDFLYHYFWREWTTIHDVRNAFRDNKELFLHLAQSDELIDVAISDIVKELNLHIDEEYFSFDKQEYSKFKVMLENVEALAKMRDPEFVMPEFDSGKREGRAYYQAEFAMGQLLKISKSFTSQCHPMNFVTAFWDRSAGHHYGIMRYLSFAQKELEKALTAMQSYSDRAARGGNKALKGTGDKTEVIAKFAESGAETIPITQDTEIISYGSPDASQAHMQAVQTFMQIMPKTLGVSDAIFAEVMTGNMTSALFKQLKEQITLANAEFAFAIDRSDITRGYIYRDMVFEMASMIKGEGAIPIKYYVGDKESLILLSRKSLSRQYGVRLVQRPSSVDEKREIAQMLLEVFPEQSRGIIAPIVLDLLPIDQEHKDKVMQMMNPQPSPEQMQQQQMQMQQLVAQTRMINAQAAQLEQQSGREQTASALNQQKATVEIDKAIADIDHKRAQTIKTEFDAAAVLANIGMQQYNMVNNMEA